MPLDSGSGGLLGHASVPDPDGEGEYAPMDPEACGCYAETRWGPIRTSVVLCVVAVVVAVGLPIFLPFTTYTGEFTSSWGCPDDWDVYYKGARCSGSDISQGPLSYTTLGLGSGSTPIYLNANVRLFNETRLAKGLTEAGIYNFHNGTSGDFSFDAVFRVTASLSDGSASAWTQLAEHRLNASFSCEYSEEVNRHCNYLLLGLEYGIGNAGAAQWTIELESADAYEGGLGDTLIQAGSYAASYFSLEFFACIVMTVATAVLTIWLFARRIGLAREHIRHRGSTFQGWSLPRALLFIASPICNTTGVAALAAAVALCAFNLASCFLLMQGTEGGARVAYFLTALGVCLWMGFHALPPSGLTMERPYIMGGIFAMFAWTALYVFMLLPVIPSYTLWPLMYTAFLRGGFLIGFIFSAVFIWGYPVVIVWPWQKVFEQDSTDTGLRALTKVNFSTSICYLIVCLLCAVLGMISGGARLAARLLAWFWCVAVCVAAAPPNPRVVYMDEEIPENYQVGGPAGNPDERGDLRATI